MVSVNSRASHPVADLRGVLARSFADGIADAAPRACATLKAQVGRCANGAEKRNLDYVARLLSSQHEQLATYIDRYLRKRFDDKLVCPEDSMSHSGTFSVEALMLFDELGMLEDVEREQCVDRLRERCRKELQVLAPYIRMLLGSARLPEARNPLFPRVLLRAFADALAGLGCDTTARRTAFRAYDPLMDRIIADVYARVNAALAEAVNIAPQSQGVNGMH